jgi:hypothetical protein
MPIPEQIRPNRFTVHGHNIQVVYTANGFEGKPTFHYQDTTQALNFKGDQVTESDSPIGKLVTVTIRETPDSGSTAFTLLVPNVNLIVGGEKQAHIHTLGITTLRRFSIVPSLDVGQLDTYSTVRLRGIAQSVIVPL